MFCDFLNVWQQFECNLPDFLGGRVVSIEGANALRTCTVMDSETGEYKDAWSICGGEIDYDVVKFEQHRGSFETTLMIRMVGGRLEVRGNPSAWGRLDNLFGVGIDDGIAIYNDVLRGLGLPEFTEGEVQRIGGAFVRNDGSTSEVYTGAHITRVDATQNTAVGMGNVAHFNKWLSGQKLYRTAPDDKQLEQFARWDWSTTYMSESKYWIGAKSYDKARALLEVTLPHYLDKLKKAAKAGTINKSDVQRLYKEAEDYLDGLALWCAEQGIARLEWSFKSRWFAQQKGLGYWRPGQTESAIMDIAEKEMDKISTRAVVYQEDAYDGLTDKEFTLLSKWKAGRDLVGEGLVSKSGFYRFRTSIRAKTGHDIGARPLHRVIEARPVFFRIQPVEMRSAPVWYQRPSVPFQLAA